MKKMVEDKRMNGRIGWMGKYLLKRNRNRKRKMLQLRIANLSLDFKVVAERPSYFCLAR